MVELRPSPLAMKRTIVPGYTCRFGPDIKSNLSGVVRMSAFGKLSHFGYFKVMIYN
ncbi:MAG: hypothetical protein K2H18_05270 [Muribaculaceae bacterium]|nr:hypothetical protein [Muribaculaceae bacterium]